MKPILLSLFLLPIVYLAARQKKWYLYLLLAFWAVLPEQMAINLHDKLPLISVSRLLVVLVFGFWIYDRFKSKHLVLPISLSVFFGINLIISLVNFRYGFGEINRVFLLIFERVLPVIMIADMISTREEFDTGIDFVIMGATALAVIGIIQTAFNYDISTPLHWVKTMASITLSERMGLGRAFGTYNAISFGCYCAMVSIATIYRLYNTKKIRYSIALALILTALICTLTRSAWLCLLAILFFMLLFCRRKLIVRLFPSISILVALCVILCFVQPNLKNAFAETGKSTMNTVLNILPDHISSSIVSMLTPSADDPEVPAENTDKEVPNRFELDENFGLNGEDPSYSRMAQWTAIEYMANTDTLMFGLGYNALPEGRIHFFFDRWGAKWEATTFLDVGLVALIAECGLVGALSYTALLGFMLVYAFMKRDKTNRMDFYHIILYTIPLFLLLNFMASFMFEHMIWVYTAMFYAYIRISNPECPDNLSCSCKNTTDTATELPAEEPASDCPNTPTSSNE